MSSSSIVTKGWTGGPGPLATKGMVLGVTPELPPFVGDQVNSFNIRRGFEGAQIILTWNFPLVNPPLSIKIIRRRNAFPITLDDGVEVFTTTSAEEFIDTDLAALDFYYYSVFSQVSIGLFVTQTINQGKELALDTGFFENRIFLDYIVPPARIEDANKQRLETLNSSTETVIDEIGQEIVNLREDGTFAKGELQRFIK